MPAAPVSGREQQPQPVVQPAQLVVLVDESGSISEDDMRRESEAAALIALGEFSPGSSVAVVGFGSDNGKPGQTPVDEVCPPITVASAQDRQTLSECVGKLRKRTKAEGDGTDHATALQQALSYFAPAGNSSGPKLVFLLTDGKLDVSESPRYGGQDNAGDLRNKAALGKIDNEILTKAREAKVAIWPLGFGNVDRPQLEHFAQGGFQGSCGANSPTPSATVVGSSADVAKALLTAFSSARCAGIGPIDQKTLPSGQTIDEHVAIPVIATDGTIVVIKHDPQVTVRFFDPAGTEMPKNGTVNDSTFQVTGENGPVEALRIVNPAPGPWTVRLTSYPNLPPIDVSAVVTWQGAVRAIMSVDPPSPQAGQQLIVSLSLQTRNRPIIDPAELDRLSFAAQISGNDFDSPIELNDAGQAPDAGARDGIYTGQVRIPDAATGSMQLTGSINGVGISGDTSIVDAQIAEGLPAVTAVSTIDNLATTVAPGGSLPGEVTVTNNSGQSRRVRLIVADPSPGAVANIPGSTTVLDLPPTGTKTFPFRVEFANNTALGPNTITVKLVDDAAPNQEIHQKRFTATVAFPPPPFPWLPVLGPISVVLALLAALLAHRARKRKRDVRGLVAYLFENNSLRGDLTAPEQPSSTFRFVLQESDHAVPKLDHATEADNCYRLTRVGGELRLETPYRETRSLHFGQQVPLTHELSVEVHDERTRFTPSEEDSEVDSSAPDWPDGTAPRSDQNLL